MTKSVGNMTNDFKFIRHILAFSTNYKNKKLTFKPKNTSKLLKKDYCAILSVHIWR